MASIQDQIRQALTATGHPAIPSSILNQITALSTSLRLSPDQLAELWEAHSLTKNVQRLDDTTFGAYKNILVKEAETRSAEQAKTAKNVAVVSRTGLGKRTSPSSSVTPSPMGKRGNNAPNAPHRDVSGDVGDQNRSGLSAVDHIGSTPEGGVPSSPSGKDKDKKGGENDGNMTGTPGRVVTPPKPVKPIPKTPKYKDRADPGAIVTTYNPHNLPSAFEVLQSKSEEEQARIATKRSCSISYHERANHPQETFRHMFTPLERRARALEDRLLGMGDVICEKHGVKRDEDDGEDVIKMETEVDDGAFANLTPVGIPKQNKVVCVGRVCNEAHEGRLNRTSIRLEGSRAESNGARIHLDLSSFSSNNDSAQTNQSYSLFPGQIVAIEGINSSGRTLQASRVLEGAPPPSDKFLASELLDYHHGPKGQNGLPLSIISVCGPFTTKDNLDYDPLLDVILKITEEKPDVVIMCGPFVDGRQPLVQGGEPIIEIEGVATKASFEQVFANKISLLLEELFMGDPSLKTQFVLVPSVQDVTCDSVYPQPPMVDQAVPGDALGSLGLSYVELAGRENTSGRKPKRVHCVSNPCTLRINELSIGVTSSDVLFHISSDETNANLMPGSRLTRIAQHLIQQRSYYPLFPAAKGACLDLAKADQWEMPCQPDILIVPSKLATFARRVLDNTIVINPGELTKNTTGGTYATINVHPMKRETLEDGLQADMEMENVIQDRVRVDIKRI